MTTTTHNHAAALALLEEAENSWTQTGAAALQQVHDAWPELAALYRAGVELRLAQDVDLRNATIERRIENVGERKRAHDAFDAALAAVADKLTGEGK